MPADLTARNIRTIDQFLELMAKAIFASGFSWMVVDKRWPEIRQAFQKFSAPTVVAFTDDHLRSLGAEPGVIANEQKIEAVRAAAGLLIDRKAEFGSIGRWLESMEGFDEQQRALRAARFVGPFGAYFVLSVAGFEVPDYETWRLEYAPGMRAG
jgi:3-methyladenine DNA glycosylase Tag